MLEEVSRTHHIHNVGPVKEDDAPKDADDWLGDDIGNDSSEDELLKDKTDFEREFILKHRGLFLKN